MYITRSLPEPFTESYGKRWGSVPLCILHVGSTTYGHARKDKGKTRSRSWNPFRPISDPVLLEPDAQKEEGRNSREFRINKDETLANFLL